MADSRQKDYGPAYRHDGLAHNALVGLFIVDDWKSRRYELRNYALALVFPVMIVAKILVAKVLPAKYFYDNNRVLGMTLSDSFADAWEEAIRSLPISSKRSMCSISTRCSSGASFWGSSSPPSSFLWSCAWGSSTICSSFSYWPASGWILFVSATFGLLAGLV